MLTGYMCLVHDYGHQYLTGFLLVLIQTAFIGYMTDIVNIGNVAATGMGFIPAGTLCYCCQSLLSHVIHKMKNNIAPLYYFVSFTNCGLLFIKQASIVLPSLTFISLPLVLGHLIAYSPSETDVAFVGAMGILGVLCYGICFLGSLAFMAFSIYAYQVGKPGDRSAGYYRGRLAFYSGLLVIVGLAQLMLGAYILR